MFENLKRLLGIEQTEAEATTVSLSKEIGTYGQHFMARELNLSNLLCPVTVEVYDGPGIETVIKGTPEAVEKIIVEMKRDTLHVSSKEDDFSVNNGSVTVSRNGSISVSGTFYGSVKTINGKVYINGKPVGDNMADIEPPTVSIRVPYGTAISLTGMFLSVDIGKVEGPLVADIAGSGKITVDSALDTDILNKGFVSIRVGAVHGKATLRTTSSGKIDIDAGSITQLAATTSGFGDITVKATVEGDATLKASSSGKIKIGPGAIGVLVAETRGFGDITVLASAKKSTLIATSSGSVELARAAGDTTAKTSGFGDITIRSGVVDNLIATTSSSGSIRIQAVAQTADLKSSGFGSITLDRALTEPRTRKTSSGNIKVKQVF